MNESQNLHLTTTRKQHQAVAADVLLPSQEKFKVAKPNAVTHKMEL